MQKQQIVHFGITLVLLIGIYGAGGLVLKELESGDGCPKIWSIPACLIILVCLIIPAIAHLLKKWSKLYFIFTSIAVIIALVASILQLTGNGECPQTDNSIPMCYLSFLIFATLISLKLYQLKIKK